MNLDKYGTGFTVGLPATAVQALKQREGAHHIAANHGGRPNVTSGQKGQTISARLRALRSRVASRFN